MTQLTPPTWTLFLVSLILVGLGVAGKLVPSLPFSGNYWLPVVGYILLSIGVLVRGI